MLSLLLDGFQGNLTTAKWARIAKCSRDTAQQDINGFIGHGILARKSEGSRSTTYRLIAKWCGHVVVQRASRGAGTGRAVAF